MMLILGIINLTDVLEEKMKYADKKDRELLMAFKTIAEYYSASGLRVSTEIHADGSYEVLMEFSGCVDKKQRGTDE